MKNKDYRSPPLENPELYLPSLPKTQKIKFQSAVTKYRKNQFYRTLDAHSPRMNKSNRYRQDEGLNQVVEEYSHPKIRQKSISKRIQLSRGITDDKKRPQRDNHYNGPTNAHNRAKRRMFSLEYSQKRPKRSIQAPLQNQQKKGSKILYKASSNNSNDIQSQHASLLPQQKNKQKLKAVSVTRKTNNYLFDSAKNHFQLKQYGKAIELLHTFQAHIKALPSYKMEVYYLLGLSYINIGEYLFKILEKDQKYDKVIYLALAQSFHKLGRIQDALEQINEGLRLYKSYEMLWMYRGKIYLRIGNHKQGFSDLDKAIEIAPHLGEPYYEKAATLKALKRYSDAIFVCSQGVDTDLRFMLLELRGKCYFNIGNFSKASHDFGKCSQNAPQEPSFLYLRGLCFYSMDQKKEAYSILWKSIKAAKFQIHRLTNKLETSQTKQEAKEFKKMMVLSFQLILSIQLEDKQIDEADESIKEFAHYMPQTEQEESSLKDWRLFIGGAFALYSQKQQKCVMMIDELLSLEPYCHNYSKQSFNQISPKRNQERYKILKSQSYIYRAYAKIIMEDFDGAFQDYNRYTDVCTITGQQINNNSYRYNYLIIQSMDLFPRVNSLLVEASKIYPTRPQPYLFMAFEQLHNQYLPLLRSSKTKNKPSQSLYTQLKAPTHKRSLKYDDNISITMKQHLLLVSRLILKSIQLIPSPYQQFLMNPHINYEKYVAEFYYFLSVITLSLLDNEKAMQYIKTAIQKSGADNLFENGSQKNSVEGLSKRDKKRYGMYFYVKGLIHAFSRDYDLALEQYNVAITLQVHLGKQPIKKVYLEKAKCCKLLDYYDLALQSIYEYINLAPQDSMLYEYLGILLFQNYEYSESLSALLRTSYHSQNQRVILTKAKCYFMCNQFDVAQKLLIKYKDTVGTQQYDMDIALMDVIISLDTDSSYENCLQNLNKLREIETKMEGLLQEKKRENEILRLFKVGEVYELKGCLFMMVNQFQKGLQYFEKSLKSFKSVKAEELRVFELQMRKQQFSEEVLNAKEYLKNQCWQRWNVREIQLLYNIAIAYLGMKVPHKAVKALEDAEKVDKTIDVLGISQVLALTRKINTGSISVTKKMFLQGFESSSLISRNWPIIKIPGYEIGLSVAFTHPYVEPPQFLPEIHEQIFEDFKIETVQMNLQAPWIKRNQKGQVFTQKQILQQPSMRSQQNEIKDQLRSEVIPKKQQSFQQQKILQSLLKDI